jgi:NDP-sugar pyrophosphorylase family protein
MAINFKAVILAAGKGTRMKELTANAPKPMLEVRGKPVLEIIVGSLRGAGVREICVITGYRAEAIKNYFGNGARHGVRVTYVTQQVQDGTGKAPELAKEFVGNDPFFLAYGDILTEPSNYRGMVETFREGGCDGVVTVKKGEDVSKGAAVVFDKDFYLTDIVEKPPKGSEPSQWYNTGIYLFTQRLFDYTAQLQKSSRGEYELPDALRAMARDGVKLRGFELRGYWLDVRDPGELERAQVVVGGLKV